jgi:hypothetical protein
MDNFNSFNWHKWLDFIDSFHKQTSPPNDSPQLNCSYRVGSYILSSYISGSFFLGSYRIGSFFTGSYQIGSYLSFNCDDFEKLPNSIKSEPLNLFGYGMDLI